MILMVRVVPYICEGNISDEEVSLRKARSDVINDDLVDI